MHIDIIDVVVNQYINVVVVVVAVVLIHTSKQYQYIKAIPIYFEVVVSKY